MIKASLARRISHLVRPRPDADPCLTIDEWMTHVESKIRATSQSGLDSGGQFVPATYRTEIAARLRAAGYRVHETVDHCDHLSIHWESP